MQAKGLRCGIPAPVFAQPRAQDRKLCAATLGVLIKTGSNSRAASMIPASRPKSPSTDQLTSSTLALRPVVLTRARSDVTR
ncbi:hypothetical protein ACW0JT_22960 [Arthrobacter sp. SA17]